MSRQTSSPSGAPIPPQDSELAETRAALVAMSAEAAQMAEAVGGSVTEAVAGWLAPQYARAARDQLEGLEGAERLDLLRTFARDWALLRKGDHTADRMRIDRERLEMEREKSEDRTRARFEEWLKQPEVVQRIIGKGRSDEEKARRLREIFNLATPRSKGLSAEVIAEMESALQIL